MKLRVGIIGLGVGEAHIAGYQAHPDCQVVGLCDIQETVCQAMRTKYPGIHVVYQADGGWLRKQAKLEMSTALQKSIPIDLVFAHNDEMGTGAQEATAVFSGIKKPTIVGIDALPGTDGGIQKVLSGILDATFIYPTGGEKAIQTAVRILNKEPFDRDNILYTAVVDKTNARVLKLQTDQIIQHQNRIGQLNVVLNQNLAKYSTQRILLVSSLMVLFLILILLFLIIRAYSSKNKSNKILESQNIAISKQKEELSEQRDQLITLSKNLEDATQAKLVFFTNISHEFRTPLTLLHGPLESMLKNETLSEDGTKLAHIMRKNVQILMKLIDQIIEFRRYEIGQLFESAWQMLQIAQRRVDMFEGGLLKEAENAVEVARAAHRFGERGLLEFLDTQRILRGIVGDSLLARFDLQSAAAEIDRLRAHYPKELLVE